MGVVVVNAIRLTIQAGGLTILSYLDKETQNSGTHER